MHYHAEIVIAEEGDVEELVREAMAPFREDDDYDKPNRLWDWYQIGGRYTGSHDDYDPAKDPRNIITCIQCVGTGKRDDRLGREARARDPSYTCNGCQGKGTHVAWPTQWVKHGGDIASANDVSEDLKCYTLILPDGEVLVQERWTGETWDKTGFDGRVAPALRARGITSGRLVTVDYHS